MEILLVVLACFSGIVAGMGMGGGTFLIPVLTIIFSYAQHTAQGINLLVFIPCAIVSLIIHIKNGFVNFKVGVWLILIGLLGSIPASFLALQTQSELLKKLFGGFLVLIGIYQTICAICIVKKCKKPKNKRVNIRLYSSKMFK